MNKALIAEKHRSSNIELLRIFSMLMIVAHHYVVNSGVIPLIDLHTHLNFIDYFLLLFGWAGKTGINCFVIITGYFMCTSDIKKNKFIRLIAEVYFYKIIIWCLFLISGYESFTFKSFLKMLFPFSTIADNFTGCYLLFYLIIPYLNKLIHTLTEKEHFYLMLWSIGVYVILPSFINANVIFNYITWFTIIYIIASYIRLYPKKYFENKKLVSLLFGCSLLLSWLSIISLAGLSRIVGKKIYIAYFFVTDSNKILALCTSIFCFLFFRNFKIGYSKIINLIASCSFGVLLIHANSDTMRYWLWNDICNVIGVYKSGNIIIHAFTSVLIIYICCTIIDFIRIKLFEEPIFKILEK